MNDGVVYFAAAPGNLERVKIGYTQHLYQRMRSLRVVPLVVLPGSLALERTFHERFNHLRVEGEWFHNAGLVRKFLEVMG